jgi:hypothetical protein
MLLQEDPYSLIKYQDDYIQFLLAFVNQAHLLNYYEPDLIVSVRDYCKRHLSSMAASLEPNDKSNIKSVVNPKLASFVNRTTGTTGPPFEYCIWLDTYHKIESKCHYKLICDEFNIPKDASLLDLTLNSIEEDKPTITKHQSNNPVESHGLGSTATIYKAHANYLYMCNYYQYYKTILNFLQSNSIDLILCNGQTTASLLYNCKLLNITAPICRLLSNTNSKAYQSDLDQYVTLGLADYWCDHMRCWDGGVTFITCKHQTRHLLDGLSWAECVDGRLFSYDYYSVTYPFYNYWNGDYCNISSDFKLCECGRYYREFEVSRSRDRSVTPIESNERRQAILDHVDTIVRVETHGYFLRLFTTQIVPQQNRARLRSSLPGYLISFIVVENGI